MTRDQDAIALAERVLGILEEGSFSATYKFALFTAILDLCIEKTDRPASRRSADHAPTRREVVELYWNHADPYSSHGTLRQGGVRAASRRRSCNAFRSDRARWADAQPTPLPCASGASQRVRRARRLRRMEAHRDANPRLQVLGRQEDRFLYDYNWESGRPAVPVAAYQRGTAIGLRQPAIAPPGVAEQLVRLNGVLRPLFLSGVGGHGRAA